MTPSMKRVLHWLTCGAEVRTYPAGGYGVTGDAYMGNTREPVAVATLKRLKELKLVRSKDDHDGTRKFVRWHLTAKGRRQCGS